MSKGEKISWSNTLFLTLLPVVTLVLTYVYFQSDEIFNWYCLGLGLLLYIISGLSITAGYHRLFSHRSYEASGWVKFLFLVFGAAAFQNSALKWCSDHRKHHRFTDTDKDPYNIKKGFWYAHIFWVFFDKDRKEDLSIYCPDLMKSRLIMWQHQYYLWIAITVGILLPLFVGWALGSLLGGVVFGILLRLFIVHHITFAINSVSHWWGTQPYSDRTTAKDNLVMSFLAHGEGYHNYHHAFQNDYRNGIRWYHWDPTKWMIQILRLMGWAKRLKQTSEENILKMRLHMQEKRAQSKPCVNPKTLAVLRLRVESAQSRWRQLTADYKKLKGDLQGKSKERLRALKVDISLAKREFRMSYAEWCDYVLV